MNQPTATAHAIWQALSQFADRHADLAVLSASVGTPISKRPHVIDIQPHTASISKISIYLADNHPTTMTLQFDDPLRLVELMKAFGRHLLTRAVQQNSTRIGWIIHEEGWPSAIYFAVTVLDNTSVESILMRRICVPSQQDDLVALLADLVDRMLEGHHAEQLASRLGRPLAPVAGALPIWPANTWIRDAAVLLGTDQQRVVRPDIPPRGVVIKLVALLPLAALVARFGDGRYLEHAFSGETYFVVNAAATTDTIIRLKAYLYAQMFVTGLEIVRQPR